MPLLVNMAVPVKEHIRESQIYFLTSAESASQEKLNVERRYLIFKTLELILSLCSLMLFAYSMRATENEIVDMLKYIILGGLTIYPLLFIQLSIRVKRRPVFSIIFNIFVALTLFVISATTMSSSWTKIETYFNAVAKEKSSEILMQLRSSCLISITGVLYFVESLIMCIETKKNFSVPN